MRKMRDGFAWFARGGATTRFVAVVAAVSVLVGVVGVGTAAAEEEPTDHMQSRIVETEQSDRSTQSVDQSDGQSAGQSAGQSGDDGQADATLSGEAAAGEASTGGSGSAAVEAGESEMSGAVDDVSGSPSSDASEAGDVRTDDGVVSERNGQSADKLTAEALAAVERQAGSLLVDESFKNTKFSSDKWAKVGDACLTAGPEACTNTQDSEEIQGVGDGKGYLQLTDNSAGKSGAVLYNQAIPSRHGLDITFTEYMYHTSSQGGYGDNGADGMSFFLTDGAATLSKPGAAGAGLGYASKDDDVSNGRDDKEEGIVQGVLGIGLDMFGNFSKEHDGNREVGGESCPAQSGGTGDSVTLRGAGAVNNEGKWMDGYCRLATQSNAGLKTDAATDSAEDANGKTVRIRISPLEEGQEYQTVTVWIGDSQVLQYTLQYKLPTTIKFGFSASTGGNHQVHLVRGLTAYSVNAVGDISVAKQVDKDKVPGYTDEYTFTSGQTVPYVFTVTNGGQRQLTDITVKDPLVADVQCPESLNPLDPGESVTCTGSLVLSDAQAAAGSLTNTVTAQGSYDGKSVSDTDSVTVRTVPSLGTPAHRKWVKKVDGTNDTYQLNLDVTGDSVSSSTTMGQGADVVVVFDKSGSMKEDNRLATAKQAVTNLANALLTEANGKLEDDKQVQMSIVQFSTTADSASKFTNSATTITDTVDEIKADGGTNWEAALAKANNASSKRSDVSKYIVFVSDGNPTYRVSSYDGCYEQRGWLGSTTLHPELTTASECQAKGYQWGSNPDGGSSGQYGEGNKDTYGFNYAAAVAEANKRGAGVVLFSVSSAKDANKMSYLATDASGTYFDGSDSNKLTQAFKDIAQTITSSSIYTIQSIQDTLSQWVDPAWTGELKKDHIKVYRSGTELTSGWSASYDSATRTVKVTFDSPVEATKNDTFRIAFNIRPNNAAYEEYARQGYPSGVTGDVGTDAEGVEEENRISEGKPGFSTNDKATVTYCVVSTTTGSDGQEQKDCRESEYAKPVIPVVKAGIKVIKKWVDASGKTISAPSNSTVGITLKRESDKYATGSVTAKGPDGESGTSDDWSWSMDVAAGSGDMIYTVEETTSPKGWTPSYSVEVFGEGASVVSNEGGVVKFTGGKGGQSAVITITNRWITAESLPLTGGVSDRDWLTGGAALGGLALLLVGAAGIWRKRRRVL